MKIKKPAKYNVIPNTEQKESEVKKKNGMDDDGGI